MAGKLEKARASKEKTPPPSSPGSGVETYIIANKEARVRDIIKDAAPVIRRYLIRTKLIFPNNVRLVRARRKSIL